MRYSQSEPAAHVAVRVARGERVLAEAEEEAALPDATVAEEDHLIAARQHSLG